MASFLQLRKRLRNLERLPPKKIFTSQTIKDHYAFHHGGRKELQFNIGFIERDGEDKFRYGVALSLEESQSLPDYTVLDKKFIRFSDFIKTNKSKLSKFEMYYHDDERDDRVYIPVTDSYR